MNKNYLDFNSIKPNLKCIATCIVKAVGEDTKAYKLSNHNETNNGVRNLRGDWLNTNLRNMTDLKAMELHPFRRKSWDLRLLIDRVHKLTFTICTKQALSRIKRANRQGPHYLETLLQMLNSNVESEQSDQLTLFDVEEPPRFNDEAYCEDFKSFMGEEVSLFDGYMHVVVVYEYKNYSVTYLEAEILTPGFKMGQRYDMMELITPDFIDLTSEPENRSTDKNRSGLVRVKPELARKKSPKPEPLVSVKKEEEGKQA